jgi:hypothetical protein
MNRPPHTSIIVLYLFLLYFTFLVIGILLAYRFGLGWFFLLHTISVLLASSPRLYIPVVRLLVSKESSERLQERLSGYKRQWFVPKSATALNLFNLLLTALAFWKINTPLHVVLSAFFSR